MKANRGADTALEWRLRRALHARGWRYRVGLRMKLDGLAIRPDLAFTRLRVAMFCDGCYWHMCPIHGSLPKSNEAFWRQKLEGNRRRDREQDRALSEAGWTVIRIWEHEDTDTAVKRIENVLHEADA